ncbi:hypothetical protein EDB81DRAFT_824420 [Dactylonectria macrodidyma]|uniref:Uncharacterized protein n=1 Tax=Dactylonectria macrodidyma TaxID=307937 RepID=A0A9P9IB61_9HYPO|nr:hypothetical protein EDB81DRAFT_824420 [Dactylonectria macrodidyma]
MKIRILASQTSWKLASLGIRIRRLANSPAFMMLIVSMLKYGCRHTPSDVEDYAGSCHCFVSAPESALQSALQSVLQSALVLRLGLGLGLFDGNLLFSRHPQLTGKSVDVGCRLAFGNPDCSLKPVMRWVIPSFHRDGVIIFPRSFGFALRGALVDCHGRRMLAEEKPMAYNSIEYCTVCIIPTQ